MHFPARITAFSRFKVSVEDDRDAALASAAFSHGIDETIVVTRLLEL